MIPILYAGNEKNFLNNGLGRLSDSISCKVTEERNGIFELEMTYPITGIHYKDISLARIILAKTEEGGSNQAFIIYSITRPLNGIVTIKANHISYLLNGFVVMPFDAVSLADAMSKINQYSAVETPFTFYTDVSSSVHFSFDTPRSIRSLLGGEQGSLLDTYGGYDYRFDNFQVSLLADRGNDNGVVLRYGKNLTELKNLDNTTNVYTGIVPYWKKETEEVYLPEKVVLSEHASDYPYKIIKTVDFSQEFENEPSQAQLRAKAVSYLANNKGWILKNNIDISFVALWQSEEYKDIAALERVRMCDTVRVVYSKLGVDIKARVIKTVYNVLLDRYDSISLGDATYNLSQAIQDSIMEPQIQKTQSFTRDAVARATKLIQGGLGGHVVFNTNGDGEPQEILIMDTDDIATAVNVIRMNLNGIGFSHNGYNGPFETAWTIDGSFVADFITAGTLNAALITTGILKDAQNLNYWNMQTGDFKLTAGAKIGNSTIASTQNVADGDSATLTAANTAADSKISNYNTNLNQQAVFNKLTNNGQNQGIYLENGELYINGEFIKANSIKANSLDVSDAFSLHGEFVSYKNYQSVENYYKLDMNASTLSFYAGGQLAGRITPEVYGSVHSISITCYDKNTGNPVVKIGPTGIEVPSGSGAEIITDVLKVNGLNDKSVFYREVEFLGINSSPVTFKGPVYDSSGSTVFVSDKRKKRSIKDLVLEKAKSFIMRLKPRQFKFNKDISKSDRYHHGFIAQEVKEVMDEDWGVYVEDEKRDFIGLRYDELIADMVAVIQDQEKRIDALERKINDITGVQS